MKKPELKVVRFDAEDVIATSAGYALRSETNGYNVTNYADGSSDYVALRFNNGIVSYEGDYTTPGSAGNRYYTWYDNGAFWRDSKTMYSEYSVTEGSGDAYYHNNGEWANQA